MTSSDYRHPLPPLLPISDLLTSKPLEATMSRTRAVRDDLSIEEDAKVNVDYLAHSWTYDEMWATRKHVRQINQHSIVRCRFENALWRAWMASTRQTIRMPAAFISW